MVRIRIAGPRRAGARRRAARREAEAARSRGRDCGSHPVEQVVPALEGCPGTYFGVSAACLKVNLVIAAVASAQESSSRAAPGPWRQLRLAWIGTPHELTAIQLANQTHIAPCGKEIHGYAERNERRAKPAELTAKIAASADRLRQNRASHLRPADLGSSLSTARGSRNGMQFHRREQPPLGSSRQAHDRREPRAAPSRSQERLGASNMSIHLQQ